MFEIYGQAPESFVPSYQNLRSCFHPEDRHLLDDRTAYESGQDLYDYEHRIITSGGEVRWVFQRIQIERNTDHIPVAIKGVIQDITEKRKADQKFKAIFDHSGDTILIGDDHGNCHDANDAAVRMFGYSRYELQSLNLSQIIRLPDDTDFSTIWKPFLEGKIENGVMQMSRKDGSKIVGSFTAKAHFLPGLHLCMIKDVTEHVKQRNQLLASEKRFKALAQEGADLIAVVDIEGNYLFVGDSSYPILGTRPQEYIGKNAFHFIHPEDQESTYNLFLKLHTDKQVKIDPFRFFDSQGEWRWVASTATNLIDDEAVGGIVVNSRDITDDVLKSNALKISNERYNLLMKAANEAVYDWDIVSNVVEWGTGFQDVFGYDLSLHHNKLWLDNIHPDDKNRVIDQVQRTIKEPAAEMMVSEYRYLKADRSVATVEHRMIFLRNQQGAAIRAVGSLKDKTAYEQNLSKIKQQNEQLTQIAWTQSHVVRAPLSRMMGLLEMLQAGEHEGMSQQEILDHIHNSAGELDQVVKNIINLAENR